ncbi:hypothetical protein LOZ58_004198 [Ophidiomyces ophidiicola]|nr:hypothetical protein LOZ58_004198 [Ophidiomyces ophidiicola]
MASILALLAISLFVCVHAAPTNAPPSTPSPSAGTQPPTVKVNPEPKLTPELKAARHKMEELKKIFQLDLKNPPFVSTEKDWQSTCFAYWGLCPGGAGFFYKNRLMEISNVEILYKAVTERETINTGNETTNLKTIKSTWITAGRTQGWSIEARLSGNIGGDNGGAKMEVSASYSDVKTESKTDIVSAEMAMPCPANHMCAIETWTFFAKVAGSCKPVPWVHCGYERNMCDLNHTPGGGFYPPFWSGCQQFLGQALRCDLKNPRVDCEATLPIFDQSGNPIAPLVTLQNEIT